MKAFNFFFFVLLAILTNSFSCEKVNKLGEDNPCTSDYKVIKSFNGDSGVIGFNKSLGQYFISKHVEGTIDEVYILYPCNLPDEFKKENLKIKLSGELFTSDILPKPSIGGQMIFHIHISEIVLLEK